MASSGTAKVTLPTDEQILITRRFAAPRHLVYRAWATPELVKQWWSGGHGTVAVAEIDLRVGGRWRYVIAADGGVEVAFHGEYREIVPNERIVTTEVFEMPGAPALPAADEPLNIVTFAEVEGHTDLSLLVQTSNKELRDLILNSGMESGMQQQMDILEQLAMSLGS
jgi:uncharacterized protein YndB with AHSA1/START domain